jgi:hypothetical protein
LANRCGLSIQTIVDYELERRKVASVSVAKMCAALQAAGIEFINGRKPGVRLKAQC